MEGLVARECPDISTKGESDTVPQNNSTGWCCDSVCLPCGDGKDMLAVYRTLGPYIRNVSLEVLTDTVHAGKPFLLEVSGYLAAPPTQPTGIYGLEGENLSSVDVQFSGKAHKGQSSHSVIVQDDGFFTFSSDWMLENPGTYQIKISVSNLLSQLFSSLYLSVFRPSPEGLEVSLVQGQGGTPSCLPYPAQDTLSRTLEKAYLGDTLTLQAYVGAGIRVKFHWRFISDNEKEEEEEGKRRDVKLDCLPDSDCLSSTVSQLFKTEGIHTVKVNASNKYGWTEKTIHIAVVRRVVCDLTLESRSGYHLAAGQNISVDLQLYTTQRQSLMLNLTLTYQGKHSVNQDHVHNLNQTFNHDDADHENNQNHDQAEDHYLNQNQTYSHELDHFYNFTLALELNHNQTHGHDNDDHTVSLQFTHTLSLSSYPQLSSPLHLCSSYGLTSCHLQFHLHYPLPSTVGQYTLSATVFSLSDSAVPLLSACLPCPLVVYDRIRTLWPAGTWSAVVPSRSELNLTVTSQADRMGSKVLWTVARGNTTVLNRITEGWTVTMTFSIAGTYLVTVKAFNPISWVGFHTHFLVQDPVGEFLLNIPRVVTVNCPTAALFTVTTGSNMSVVVLTNTSVLYQNNSYTAGEEVTVGLLFDCTGTTEVKVRAENLVSSENRSVNVCVQLVRKWSHTVTMDITLPPVTCPSLALSTKVNGALILAHEVTTEEPIGDVLLVLATPAVIRLADFINATALVVRGGAMVFEWQVSLPEFTTHSHTDRNTSVSSLHLQAVVPGMYNITVTTYCLLGHTSVSRHLEVRVHGPVGQVQVQYPFGSDRAALHLQAVGTYATSLLLFRGHSFSHSAHFVFDFGDGLPTSYVNGVSHSLGNTASTYHQFTKEGVFQIRVWAYNEFYRSMATERVFYVEKVPAGLDLSAHSSVVHKNQVVLFEALLEQGTNVSYTWSMGDQTTYVNAGAVVSHVFLSLGAFEVCVLAENKVGSVSHCVPVSVLHRMQSVSIHTEKQAYATNTDITFLARTEEPDPVEFLWHFGDSRPLRTTSRSLKKTYHTPDRYSVVVVASNGLSSFTSEVHPVLVQRAVRPNRLLLQPSVVLNHTASFTCRVNSGTNLSYSWSFGDGTSRTGGNTEQHVFHRTGEFTVEVTVSNLVSSASLTAQMFVVDRPCKPPAVKNMGPLKIQARRYEPVGLGVTYEAEVQCDVFQGLEYNWSLYNSTGLPVPLPPVHTDRQSITLPSYFLHYGIYTATAKVQIVGSVVYSNYSVCVEVVPSPLVSFIHGGTNMFLSSRNSSIISLNGQLSYDPDYPMNHLSYSWTCKPISAIDSSCFDQYVPTSFSVIVFPVGFLKQDFDQFRFMLTVQSGERSSTADTFITVTPSLLRRVSVYCYQCQGDVVNWDQSFSVRAVCDSCGPSPRTISYTWTLYLVDSSSKVDTDVPFCHSVDLSIPSNIISGPTFPLPPALTLTPPSSPLHTPSIPATLVTGLMSSNVTSQTEIQSTTPTTPDPVPLPPFTPLPPFPLSSPSPGGRPRKQRSQGSVELQGINSAAGNNQTPNYSPPFLSLPNHSVLANPSPISSPEPISAPISFTPDTPEPDLGGFDPSGPPYLISESPVVTLDDGSILFSAPLGQSDIIEEFPIHPDFPNDYDFPFPVLESGDVRGRPVEGSFPGQSVSGGALGHFPGSDPSTAETSWDPNGTLEPSGNQTGTYNFTDDNVPFLGIEEGDPGASVGRPTGVGGGNSESSEGDSAPAVPGSAEDEGSNLMDSSPSLVVLDPTLLDLPRELLEPELFESYTYTGISSALITFRPFTLRAGSRYMLEVTANSHDAVLGRTQLFLSTSPSPQGITCQVQPSSGFEIHTHFSIFCTSGKEDLLYEYSFSIGNSPPKTLYQGRDFQYFFNLPSGDPQDDYKVTIYTEVRNRFGAATAPCPVTVTVHPSFIRNTSSNYNPDMELFESGLRNLSDLVQLGNSVEIRNYIILLSSVLNRLSQDPTANTHTQSHTRTALINAVCQLDINDQRSMTNNIYMLKDLMHLTHQVSLASASVVVGQVQSISDLFHQPSVPVPYLLDSWTLNTLVTLLSYSLQATPTTNDVRQDQATADDVIQAMPTLKEQAIQLTTDSLQTTDQLLLKYILFNKVEQHNVTTSVMDLQTTHHDRGLTTVISSGSATFYLPDSLDLVLYGRRRRETENGKQSLCVLSQLTTFTHNLYFWTKTPVLLSGPVIDLTLYNCSTRREIPVRSLSQPINIEFPKTPRNVSSLSEFTLLRSQVNYHGLNITQQALQEAILVSVEFTRPPNKTFPIMLLFRMFERPTPSLYHIHSIYHWDGNTTYIILPPSYLTAAGTGYLALLNADYKKTPRHKYMSRQVNYTLRLETSQCLSWDHQEGWTHTSCTPQLGLTSHTRVNCSCSHLSPLTVVQQQIQSSHDDSADLAQFISLPSDLTVVCVCVVCVCLYALGMVVCKRADLISERNQGVYYLSDNAPLDTHLYSVTIHTGLRSSPSMTAKVHIVLYGEDGVSQTRQLHDPECYLFRRNSRNTFILSTVDSLGPLWGLHLWHDNTGPSPTWYLRQVEVCEVKGKGRSWLFLGQCWLAVDEGDRQVERRLRVCDQGPGFTKLLYLKLSEYLSDFHLWLSVYCGPSPSVFTHTQRLSVCLLLLLGYMCVNTLLISGLDDQYTSELGIIDVSTVSLTTGLLSALAVLPVASALSFLFRQREVRVKRSEVKQNMVRLPDIYSIEADALIVSDCVFDSLSWNNLQQCAQEAWRKKYEGSVPNRDLVTQRGDLVIRGSQDLVRDLLTQEKVSSDCNSSGFDSLLGRLLGNSVPDNNSISKERDRNLNDSSKLLGSNQVGNSTSRCLGGRLSPLARWSHLLAWVLCLALGLSSLVVTIVLGIRFSSSKTLLWIHSVFFSLLSCVFLIQPAVILAVAVVVSFWRRKRPDFSSFSGVPGFQAETMKLWTQDGSCVPELFLLSPPHPPQERCSHFDRVLAARRRARYLRLVRPPTSGELRRTGGRKRRETLIRKTLREMAVCVSMLFLLLCVTYGSSFRDQYHLNHAVRTQFTRSPHNPFLSIQTHEEWWNWTLTSVLDGLDWDTWYNNISATGKAGAVQGTCILIGEPILRKIDVSNASQCQVPPVMATLFPECLTERVSGMALPMEVGLRLCGQLQCYTGTGTTVRLGLTRSEIVSRLESLRSAGWLDRLTVAMATQFTLYSPHTNLFNSVNLMAERLPGGALHTSARVQSARVYHSPTVWDYFSMACQLLFLLVSLVQLVLQICSAGEKGMLGYLRDPQSWLQASILLVTLVYYIYYIYQSILTLEVVDLLQRHDFRMHVDVSLLSIWEQHTHTLRGILLFLLVVRCLCLSGVNRTMAASVTLLRLAFSRLLWPMLSGVVLLVALSSVGNLLLLRRSWGSSSLPHSVFTLLSLSRGQLGSRAHSLPVASQPHQLHSPNSLSLSFYHGALCLTLTVAWTAVLTGIVSSLVRAAKLAGRRRCLLTLCDVVGYVRGRAAVLIGQRRQRWTDSHAHRRSFYLEEFESLVDELQFRLNAFSNSLHHTLHPKDIFSPTQSPSSLASQRSAASETAHVTEETLLNAPPDITNLPLTSREHSPDAHHYRSQLELETLHHLQQSGQRRQTPAPAGGLSSRIGPSVSPLHSGAPGWISREHPSDRKLQISTSIGGPSYLSSPDLVHLDEARTWDNMPQIQSLTGWIDNQMVKTVVLENQISHWTTVGRSGKKSHRSPRNTQWATVEGPSSRYTTASGVMEGHGGPHIALVEVMVHGSPETEPEEEGFLGTVRQCWG
uniref:polycystic kidney disease 1 like 1 n=1 Tax=Oncorhynchus gorbuscha TaxID=8017 RepID=UPI001EAF20BD|nr:polycystic kidney disease 1 like 1 [Oncorhynchus gorbuscha]